MGLRLTAAIPLFASIVAVALSIVLLVSGSSTNNADGNFWLAINTSGMGTGIVQISAANDSQTGALGGFINSIPGLDGILDNLTNSVGNGLNDVQGELLGSITSGLGLQDYYALYTSKLCQGNLTSNATDSDVTISACYSYSEEGAGLANITNSIPSSLVVGTAQVSVPLVETLKTTLSQVTQLATGAATALMVFLIIGTVAQGLVAIGSLLGVLRSKSRLITDVTLIFAMIATASIWLIAIVMSLIVGIAASLLGGFGEGLSLHVKGGGIFLVILWVAAVLSAVASSYWFVVWFVEFRKSSFSRRSRTEDQIGGYMQIVGEVRDDLRVDGHFGGGVGGMTSTKAHDKSERGVFGGY